MSLEKIRELHSELGEALRKLDQFKVDGAAGKAGFEEVVAFLLNLELTVQIEADLTNVRLAMLVEALQEKGMNVDLGFVRIDDIVKADPS